MLTIIGLKWNVDLLIYTRIFRQILIRKEVYNDKYIATICTFVYLEKTQGR